MVTCQSANQLKTPAKVSWAFKMVSQFGSLGYTITGKTADLTVVQKTIIDTLHKEGKPQTFIAKEAVCSQSAVSKHVNRKLNGRQKCGRKRCTTNRENCRLMRIVKQNRFKNWGELHKEWTEAGVKASRATTHRRVKVLPGLRRRRTGLLPSGPKSSFQMRASFVFNLETKVLESGGRVEKLIAQVAWSPVLSLHSLWWFGVQCHLLCRSIVFLKTNVTAPIYQAILEHFMLPSADQLFKDADFIFQQDLAPAHTAKSTKDLNCFSPCALNLFNTQVSQFELNYWNKLTFPRHSNLLRCTCSWVCFCSPAVLLLTVSTHMFYQIKRTALLEFIPLIDVSISIGTVEHKADKRLNPII